MNILILSWRDIKNPKGGGAEVLTHEMAKNWVKNGNQVTLFSSSFPGSLSLETIDNVRIIRQGHPDARSLIFSVHFLAFLYYVHKSKNFDIVVDEIHGLPFFTPWYVRGRKVVLICEVASNLWIKMFGPVFGSIGRILEQLYLKYIYKDIPYLTISNSTKGELINEGVKDKNITVLPMGLTVPKNIEKKNKEKDTTLIYVGRLTKSKGIEDAIKALSIISKSYSKVKLWIVGGGDKEYVNFLKKIANSLNINDRITFFGYVSLEKKFELMERAHILVVPSIKEGWGLTIPEAGRVGTPAVGYNVEGLREVILDGKTGILTTKNNYKNLAENIIKMLGDKLMYEACAKAAKKLSLSYNWRNTANVALGVLKQ